MLTQQVESGLRGCVQFLWWTYIISERAQPPLALLRAVLSPLNTPIYSHFSFGTAQSHLIFHAFYLKVNIYNIVLHYTYGGGHSKKLMVMLSWMWLQGRTKGDSQIIIESLLFM